MHLHQPLLQRGHLAPIRLRILARLHLEQPFGLNQNGAVHGPLRALLLLGLVVQREAGVLLGNVAAEAVRSAEEPPAELAFEFAGFFCFILYLLGSFSGRSFGLCGIGGRGLREEEFRLRP